MSTEYDLSKFFATSTFEDRTKVLLEICKRDPNFLLDCIQVAFKPRWEDEVEALLRAQKKIEAIKVCRAHTGWSLKEAKDSVEGIQKELRL